MPSRSSSVLACAVALLAVASPAGCGGDSSADSSAAGSAGSAGTSGSSGAAGKGGTAPEAGADVSTDAQPDAHNDAQADVVVTHECTAGQVLCKDHDTLETCADTPEGRRWKTEDCPSGQGCVAGQCVAGKCSDECNLGETDAGKTCELFDLAKQSWSTPDPATSLHDRARAYQMWIRRDSLAEGGVGSARYADPGTWSDVTYLDGIGDSAIWTGTYLASEALRLKATGDPDARANIKRLVDTLHVWFNVEGDPGVLSRFAAPSGKQYPFVIGDLDCSKTASVHCNVAYDGKQWDYIGHISRDQYQGVMLGYALAYEALGEQDEPTRAIIRGDVVELVQELMKERTVKAQITVNGTPIPLDLTMRFVVLVSSEMKNGAVQISVSTSNYADAEMWGFQEFIPDLADLLRQVPMLSWLPAIPRSSSAIMLASFFRVGMLVTDGVPGFEQLHDDIEGYYLTHDGKGGNVSNWLDVAAQYVETNKCGEKYYGHNISMEPMYNLSRLETDPLLATRVHTDVLQKKMWPLFEKTKNSFFSYIYAGTVPGVPATVSSLATEQLSQFPPPPRVKVAVDLLNDPKYPHESGCDNQCSHDTAVDVGERPVGDFLWQRHPWGLFDPGDPSQTQPGVDYLTAYWMGRVHGFIQDDSVGKCLVWK